MWADRNVLKVEGHDRDDRRLLVTFPDLASFEIDLASRSILIHRIASELSEPTLNHLLADQVLPRLVSHSGSFAVHAAGVSSPSGAILLVGLSGRGKSTLAASFHVNGYPLIGDDAMIIETEDRHAHCRPLYRSLRLFPDSIAAIFDSVRKQTLVADYTNKQNIIDLERADSLDDRIVVRSICCLTESNQNAISVRRMSPADACMAIVEQSFALDPGDRSRSRRRLEQSAALVSAVPVFEVAYRRDYDLLPDLRQMILNAGPEVV